jgi:hypothetical protein
MLTEAEYKILGELHQAGRLKSGKLTDTEKLVVEKAAHEYRLSQAEELLKSCGYIKQPDGNFEQPT